MSGAGAGGPKDAPAMPDTIAAGGPKVDTKADTKDTIKAKEMSAKERKKAEKAAAKAGLKQVPGNTEGTPPSGGKAYTAPTFDTPEPGKKPPAWKDGKEFLRYKQRTRVNWLGMLFFIMYICAFGFYLWVRITKTLGLGAYFAYGVIVLGIECLGATTVFLYGTNLLWNPVNPVATDADNKIKVRLNYHVRVIVPCYKESLDILRRTIMAAYDATMPEGCSRTIYLCDDGKDPKKRKWVDSLGADVVYVSGRKRPAGEMNGKSGNINNVTSQLYPPGTKVPGSELLCIFDADQVASREFFMKTLPLFDGGDDVGMVLSPQCFHNLNLHSDIFNHSNVHFWEYMQPGYDALGFISCTGTNFLVRSQAILEVGGSPQYTLTEDYALGMEMKKFGWHCRYVQEYLAIGEAPDQIRNCYQQRSRWCKGHFQIMLNKEHCPLLQRRLSIPMRILYMSGVWSYFVGAISTPMFVIIPVITIWFGIFPIVVSWWAALGLTVYYICNNLVLYYVRSLKHLEALWFANLANQILFWTYIKAFWRAMNSLFGDKITFKTTLKGASMLMNSAFRDVWMPGLMFVLLFISFIAGLVQLFGGATVYSPLLISICWCIYGAIPHFLVLFYVIISKGTPLQYLCRICCVLSFVSGAVAVGLMWGLYPKSYDYGQALGHSYFYLDAQRVGSLPANNQVAWRSNALTYEDSLGPGGVDISGGWLEGGVAGNLKMTVPHAFTTSILAWGLLEFPQGYKQAGKALEAMESVRWGADYLMKMCGQGSNGSMIIYQVGNWTLDQTIWDRPEDITSDRPYYVTESGAPASDLAGGIVGALAAASMVWKSTDSAYSDSLLATAADLYAYATEVTGLYSSAINIPFCPSPFSQVYLASVQLGNPLHLCTPQEASMNGSAISLYNGTTYYDALMWAASWMFKATGDSTYMSDAEVFFTNHIYSETGGGGITLSYDWSSYFWAGNVLLAEMTDQGTFHEHTQHFLQMWVCGTAGYIQFTPYGRAWNNIGGSKVIAASMNSAFLATVYAQYIRSKGGSWKKKSNKYNCWARSQARYALGDGGRSFVSGWGKKAPKQVQNEAASCPSAPATCNAVNGLLNPANNPRVLYGALVEGNVKDTIPVDYYQDVRTNNNSRVMLEYNSGWSGLLAGLQQAPGTWEECLQGYSLLYKDKTVCST